MRYKDHIYSSVLKHLIEKIDINRIERIEDFSYQLTYEDSTYYYKEGDWESPSYITTIEDGHGNTPFYRINIIYIVHHNNGKCSLIQYRGFVFEDEEIKEIKVIDDNINYIFKDMDKHIFTNKEYDDWSSTWRRYSDSFVKENSLYAYTYIDQKLHKIDIDGKVIPTTLDGRTFQSIKDDTIYNQYIETGALDKWGHYNEYNNHISLKETVYYKADREIESVEKVELNDNNSGWVTDVPKVKAYIISFTDGTKKVVVENEDGKKSSSKCFKDIKFEDTYLCVSKRQFNKEKPENKEGWNTIDYSTYYIPGLLFEYNSDEEKGYIRVRNNGSITNNKIGGK